jgi:hypothetical protein
MTQINIVSVENFVQFNIYVSKFFKTTERQALQHLILSRQIILLKMSVEKCTESIKKV